MHCSTNWSKQGFTSFHQAVKTLCLHLLQILTSHVPLFRFFEFFIFKPWGSEKLVSRSMCWCTCRLKMMELKHTNLLNSINWFQIFLMSCKDSGWALSSPESSHWLSHLPKGGTDWRGAWGPAVRPLAGPVWTVAHLCILPLYVCIPSTYLYIFFCRRTEFLSLLSPPALNPNPKPHSTFATHPCTYFTYLLSWMKLPSNRKLTPPSRCCWVYFIPFSPVREVALPLHLIADLAAASPSTLTSPPKPLTKSQVQFATIDDGIQTGAGAAPKRAAHPDSRGFHNERDCLVPPRQGARHRLHSQSRDSAQRGVGSEGEGGQSEGCKLAKVPIVPFFRPERVSDRGWTPILERKPVQIRVYARGWVLRGSGILLWGYAWVGSFRLK